MKADFLSKQILSYRKFFNNGLLLDAGPLMLMFYGEYDKKYNTDYLKEIGYDNNSYGAFNRFISGVPTAKLIITSHIFHELYKHAQKNFNSKLQIFFDNCFDKLIQMEERPIAKNTMLSHELFIELEIGEHSLICTCCDFEGAHAILHDDRKIDGKLRDDDSILTINMGKDIIPWYWTTMS